MLMAVDHTRPRYFEQFLSEANKYLYFIKHNRITSNGSITLEDVLGPNTRVRYAGAGAYGYIYHISWVTSDGEVAEIALKIIPMINMKPLGNLSNINRPEYIEPRIVRYLEKHLHNCPGFIMYFGSSVYNGFPRISSAHHREIIELLTSRNSRNPLINCSSVMITEWAKGGSILNYINQDFDQWNNVENWRNMSFQVLYILAYLQSLWPGFRHNDLSCRNILIKIVETPPNSHFTYRINHMKFKVPNAGFVCKIWDFDFCYVPGQYENTKLNMDFCQDFAINSTQNHYYDLHFFFNTLYGMYYHKIDRISHDFIQFVRDIIPKEHLNNSSQAFRYIGNDCFHTPVNLLTRHTFFHPYIVENNEASTYNLDTNTDTDTNTNTYTDTYTDTDTDTDGPAHVGNAGGGGSA